MNHEPIQLELFPLWEAKRELSRITRLSWGGYSEQVGRACGRVRFYLDHVYPSAYPFPTYAEYYDA